jgi:hypothetical protein
MLASANLRDLDVKMLVGVFEAVTVFSVSG